MYICICVYIHICIYTYEENPDEALARRLQLEDNNHDSDNTIQ